MKKIFIFLFILYSKNSLTATPSAIGEKLAECAAYNSHASVIASKIYKDNNMFIERTKLTRMQTEIAAKLIGKDQASAIFIRTSQIGRSYQFDAQNYINFIGPNIQLCDEFVIQNKDHIRQLLN